MSTTSGQMILDFSDVRAFSSWQAVDDRIMGGRSRSRPHYVESVGLRFAGTVSLANHGGFASIRSPSGQWDLSSCAGLHLRLRGDGKRYKLSLRTDLFFDGISYQTAFGTERDHWQEISLPFTAFSATHHGVRLTTGAPLDTRCITSFGLFVSGRQEGAFQLDLAWMKSF